MVERVHLTAGGDAAQTDYAFSAVPATARVSAFDLLQANDIAAAYLTAINVLNPPRTGRMMTGIWPAQAGEATGELAIDD